MRIPAFQCWIFALVGEESFVVEVMLTLVSGFGFQSVISNAPAVSLSVGKGQEELDGCFSLKS